MANREDRDTANIKMARKPTVTADKRDATRITALGIPEHPAIRQPHLIAFRTTAALGRSPAAAGALPANPFRCHTPGKGTHNYDAQDSAATLAVPGTSTVNPHRTWVPLPPDLSLSPASHER